MMRTVILQDGGDLEEWRLQARRLLTEGVVPSAIQWQVGEESELFPATAGSAAASAELAQSTPSGTVPRSFLTLASTVLAHADARRHAVLYRLLWRLTHGEKHLLDIAADDDVAWADTAAKAVRRDMHKMKAFVRFRKVDTIDGPVFVAWFEPSHDILARLAPFFVRRFAGMRWSILTPTRSAHWDGESLSFSAGARKSDAPDEDALEALWLTYFANIFNPARLKVKAMKNEMPVRYWKNMPESVLIPGMIRDASARMDAMVTSAPTTPKKRVAAPAPRVEPTMPAGSLDELRRDAKQCRACPLWEPATQTVFGEGPASARIMVIGEQPGDQEDLAGRPFVGPAGQLFDRALAQAGIPRDALYITNVVKHFKFEPRGKRRIHSRANAQEQAACRPWLLAEIERVAPQAIVCLGAMAAQSMFDKRFQLLKQRGKWMPTALGVRAFATVHPSYLLRLPDDAQRTEAYAAFVADLAMLRDVAE